MVNRPLTREMALWPDDSRLQIVSAIDLLKGSQEDLEQQIKEKVKDVESVTQVYFYCELLVSYIGNIPLTKLSIQANRRS
jgi:hypothetical protein